VKSEPYTAPVAPLVDDSWDDPPLAEGLSRIALACLVEPGNRELGQLVRARGVQDALDGVLDGRAVTGSLADAVASRLVAADVPLTVLGAHAVASRALETADRLGARIVTPADDEWPRQVEDLALISREDGEREHRNVDPPLCFWVRGAAPLRETLEKSVAVVGSRAVSSYGQHVTREFSFGLARQGWTVVSGGAFGVDATAHRTALGAGAATVAVLACGIERPYPAAHSSLFEQIAEQGLLLTEWPPGAAAYRMRFLTRNRVIAAATRGTIMVEAGTRSGARNTLTYARLLHRPAMVVPGPITSAMSVGCHAELRKPGTILVSRCDQVIEEIGPIGELAALDRGPERAEDALDSTARRLLDAVLPRKAQGAEQLAAVAGVSGLEARRALPMLVAHGFVVVNEAGKYRLAPRPKAPAS
jgi:DNA processing protein